MNPTASDSKTFTIIGIIAFVLIIGTLIALASRDKTEIQIDQNEEDTTVVPEETISPAPAATSGSMTGTTPNL